MINNAVLVPVAINGMEFRFLLDTGVKETILFAASRSTASAPAMTLRAFCRQAIR
jgi:predicted aspartyl protease